MFERPTGPGQIGNPPRGSLTKLFVLSMIEVRTRHNARLSDAVARTGLIPARHARRH